MGRVEMYRMTFGREILCYGEIVFGNVSQGASERG